MFVSVDHATGQPRKKPVQQRSVAFPDTNVCGAGVKKDYSRQALGFFLWGQGGSFGMSLWRPQHRPVTQWHAVNASPFSHVYTDPLMCHTPWNEVIQSESGKKLGTMTQACNPSAGDVGTEGWLLREPWLACPDQSDTLCIYKADNSWCCPQDSTCSRSHEHALAFTYT